MQMQLRRWHAVYAGRRFCDLNCCQCRLCLTRVHSTVWKPFSLEHALKNIATISFWQVEQSVGSINWPARSHSAGFQHANVAHKAQRRVELWWHILKCMCTWELSTSHINVHVFGFWRKLEYLERTHMETPYRKAWVGVEPSTILLWFDNATPLHHIQSTSPNCIPR